MKTKTITVSGLLISLSLILSYLESRIPIFAAVPGLKLGLANIVVVFALYSLSWKEALLVSVLRVLLSSLLFGSVLSLAYSASGAIVSFIIMVVLKKTGVFGTVGVSVAGGVMHNVGQVAVACLVLDSRALVYYLPVLIISGTIAGVAVGLTASAVIRRVEL